MVKVRALPEAAALDREGLAQWFADLPTPLEPSDRERLLTACHLLGDRGDSENRSTLDWAGEAEPLTVGLEIVQILAELRLGSDALLAGLLYRSVRQQAVDVETVRSEFGGQVAGLLGGALRMAANRVWKEYKELSREAAKNGPDAEVSLEPVDDSSIFKWPPCPCKSVSWREK